MGLSVVASALCQPGRLRRELEETQKADEYRRERGYPVSLTPDRLQAWEANIDEAERKAAAPKGAAERQEERATFTAQDEDAALVPGIPDARVWGDSDREFARFLPAVNGPWLAISGGGSDGAYGAGVLTGWSESGTRPEFAVVTGVSIGALIAPFAFLGSRYDEELHKNFTTIGAADIFEDRSTRDSLFDYWPLKRIIEQRVTAKLLSEIAAEHGRGRRLLVVTTNLDSGRRVVWNMGAIAGHGEQGLKLFRDILLASSSIPGFFSPVPIEVEANGKKFHELHGDGTLTAPFFVVPETMLSAYSAARLPFSQIYVLVNSKLGPEFKMPDRNLPGVLGRSIGVALTAVVALLSLTALPEVRRFMPLPALAGDGDGSTHNEIHRAHLMRRDQAGCPSLGQWVHSGGERGRDRAGACARGTRQRTRPRGRFPGRGCPELSEGGRRSGLGDTDCDAPSQPEHREIARDEAHEPGVGRGVALDQQT